MKRIKILWLQILICCLLAGCDLNGPMEECDYNARLLFHYSRGGSTNQIRNYVTTITDYLFDAQGHLIDVTTRTGVRIPQRTLSLPPGGYTMVSWGNLAEKTLVHPSTEVGTEFADMRLVQNNPASELPWQQNSERLHYGKIDFEVSSMGVVQKTVFVGHAYLDLTVTVVGIEGQKGEEFSFRLDGTHPVYDINHYQLINAQGYNMYIPAPEDARDTPHLLPEVRMTSEGKLEGELLSYRLTNRSQPVFSIWQGEKQILRNVDLKHFFDTMLIDMDTNECQEFHILITVDGDNVYVQFVSLGDWIDGGSISG